MKKHSISLLLLGMAVTLYALGLVLPACALIIVTLVVESYVLVRLTKRSRRSIHQ